MYYYGGVHCTVVYTEAERAFESATGWFTFVKYIEATLQIYWSYRNYSYTQWEPKKLSSDVGPLLS